MPIDLICSSPDSPIFRLQSSLRGFKLFSLKMGRRNRENNATEEVYESQGPGKNRCNFFPQLNVTCISPLSIFATNHDSAFSKFNSLPISIAFGVIIIRLRGKEL